MLLVLIAVAVATILSMSFLSSQATSHGVSQNIQRHAQARSVAESALGAAIHYVQTDANWRTDKSEGQWVNNASFNGGTFDLFGYDGLDTDGDGVVDDTDGDLADDTSDPVTLTAIGYFDGVSHTVHAVITAGTATVPVDVLLVVGNAGSLTTQDQDKSDLMNGWGMGVTLIDDGDSQANFDTAMASAGVVYVAGSVSAGTVGSKVTAATIGVVSDKGDMNDSLLISDSNGAEFNDSKIDIINNVHYITATIDVSNMDNLTITTGIEKLSQVQGALGVGVTVLATKRNNPDPTLVAISAGGQLEDGSSAAGRRVLLPWGSSIDITNLNSAGQTILKRSLEWAGQPVTPQAPIAWWTFDDGSGSTAVDASGNGHGGTVSNGTWTAGQIMGAYELNGSDGSVAVPNHSDFNLTNAMTITGWINADSWGSGFDVDIIARKGDSDPKMWQLAVKNGVLTMFLEDNDGDTGHPGTTSLNTGEWYHLAGTWDGTTVRLYVNGQPDNGAGSARAAPIATDTRSVYVGGRGTEDVLDGLIDDVRIYDYALSGSELMTIYNQGVSPVAGDPRLIALYEFQELSVPPALAGQWKLDEIVGGLVLGNNVAEATEQQGIAWEQVASQAVLAQDATVTSISVYIGEGDGRLLRLGIYSDSGGEPGSLIVESATDASTSDAYYWHTIIIPSTALSAGTYWLALAPEPAIKTRKSGPGQSQQRHKNYNGVTNGFISSWGASDSSATTELSIYAGGTGSPADDIAGNDGSYNGGAVPGVSGNGDGGTAVQFDGSDDYIEIPHSDDYLLDSGSVSFWFKPDSLSGHQGLFSKDSTNNDTGGHLHIYTNGNKLYARLQSDTASYTILSPGLSVGNWYHVVVSFGPGGWRLYLNGSLKDSDSYSGGLGTSSGGTGNHEPIVLGANTWLSDDLLATPVQDFFEGTIDDVRIYDQGFDATQANNVYTGNAPGGGVATIAYDTGGFGVPLNLDIEDPGNVSWVPGGGLTIDTATRVSSASASTKLYDALTATNQMSLEVVFTPANVTQTGPARIVSYSGGTGSRNFTFGQESDEFIARLRTDTTTSNGTPSADSGPVLTAGTREHVIVSYDGINITLYRDGGSTVTLARTGDFNWDNTFRFMLGDEITGGNDWLGTLHQVAVYDEAFNANQAANVFNGLPPGNGSGVGGVDWIEP